MGTRRTTLAWSIARKPGKSGWTDAIWSYATGAGGAVAALLAPSGVVERHILVTAMIGLWGLRLGTHIARRSLRGHDDPRYAALRKEWGAAWESRLLKFLMIQAGAGLVLILSVLAAASNPAPSSPRPIAAATCVARSVPLNESGARTILMPR